MSFSWFRSPRCPAPLSVSVLFFFFNDTAPTEIYTLSLHDALPISMPPTELPVPAMPFTELPVNGIAGDRKSTRLNSSHTVISNAVFCLKKKKKKTHQRIDDGDLRRMAALANARGRGG